MTQTDIKPFTKEDLEQADVQLLRDGRWGNARVSVANINGKRWTIKDFSDRHWLVKNSFAMRRKTLYNNIQNAYDISKQQLLDAFKLSNISDNARAENLDTQQFNALCTCLKTFDKIK